MRYFIDEKEVSEKVFKAATDNELKKVYKIKGCYNIFLESSYGCALVYFKDGVPYRYFITTW